jgi:translation initiation factor IF-3
MTVEQALVVADRLGLDLVEVSPKAVPPVCRIMDFGKFKYEQSKKTKQAKKHASVIEVKEIKFRPKTDGHDLDFKMRHIRRFLEEGARVVIADIADATETVRDLAAHGEVHAVRTDVASAASARAASSDAESR